MQTKLFHGRGHFKGPEEKKGLKVLARAFLFTFVACIIFLPVYLTIDYRDSLFVRLVVQVMLPLTVALMIGFGFMDELFFKLKLYDPDLPNASILDFLEYSHTNQTNQTIERNEPGHLKEESKDNLNESLNSSKDHA